jgi:hypothetical protein
MGLPRATQAGAMPGLIGDRFAPLARHGAIAPFFLFW